MSAGVERSLTAGDEEKSRAVVTGRVYHFHQASKASSQAYRIDRC
jgi:hypothetical protein